MAHRPLSLAVTFALAALCAAPLQAQEPPPEGGGERGGRGGRAGGGQRLQRLLERLDTNGDGALDAEEMARLPERAREKLARIDGDGDGTLSAEELGAATERAAQRAAERGGEAGATGDGTRKPGAFGMVGHMPADATVHRDLAYGENAKHKLDLYLPPGEPTRPLMVYIHGGGWKSGDKRSHANLYGWLVQQGCAVASLNYRLSGEAKFPAPLDDCTAALRWLTSKAAEYRIDASRIGLVGSSAGGHLAALVGVTNPTGVKIAGVVSYYGAHDLNGTTAEGVRANTSAPLGLMGQSREEIPDAWAKASCFTHIDASDPAFLLIHGDKDTTVPVSESTVFAEKLKASGVACELVVVKNGGHGLRGSELDPALTVVDDAFKAFVTKHLRPTPLPEQPKATETPTPESPEPAPSDG